MSVELVDLIKLKAQLTREEGLRLKPYTDTVGKLTIGVGRNLTDVGLSSDECQYLLQNDIDKVLAQIAAKPYWLAVQGDDVRSRVIVDMVFNMGLAGFETFKNMIAAIVKKDWAQVSTNMMASKWAKQVGVRANNLAFMMRNGADPS